VSRGCGQTRRRGRVAVLALAAALATGCGVQLQDQAEPLPGGIFPTVTPTPTPSATEEETLVYFVAGRQLEAVPEPVSERSAAGIMEALAAGPPVDREAELRSLLLDPLTAAPLMVVMDVTQSGEVIVQRTEGYLKLPATDQVLLTGQIVHSMAGIGIARVIVTDEAGNPAPVTLPDGRLQDGGVTAEDFAALLVDQAD
jgi:hypothetical protein